MHVLTYVPKMYQLLESIHAPVRTELIIYTLLQPASKQYMYIHVNPLYSLTDLIYFKQPKTTSQTKGYTVKPSFSNTGGDVLKTASSI